MKLIYTFCFLFFLGTVTNCKSQKEDKNATAQAKALHPKECKNGHFHWDKRQFTPNALVDTITFKQKFYVPKMINGDSVYLKQITYSNNIITSQVVKDTSKTREELEFVKLEFSKIKKEELTDTSIANEYQWNQQSKELVIYSKISEEDYKKINKIAVLEMTGNNITFEFPECPKSHTHHKFNDDKKWHPGHPVDDPRPGREGVRESAF